MRAVGLLLFVVVVAKAVETNVLFEWNFFNYTWPSSEEYDDAIENKTYIPENVIVSAIKHFSDKLFFAVPRLKHGVPATLAWIPEEPIENNTSPLLTAFPSWELNRIGDCEAFQSVRGFEIDPDGIMWIIDNGLFDANETELTCLPSLSVLDLNERDPKITRYIMPENIANASSCLNDIVLDNLGGGFAYITDGSEDDPGIIVFSKSVKKFWKFREPNSMKADEDAQTFTIDDINYNITMNIYGIALGPHYFNKYHDLDRNVYFSSLSSFDIYGTSSLVLRHEFISSKPEDLRARLVTKIGEKSSQSAGIMMDEAGYFYHGLIGNHEIVRWNHTLPFEVDGQELIARIDTSAINWVNGFAIDNNRYFFILSNNFHNYITDNINQNEINYRILVTKIESRNYMYSRNYQH